MTRNDVILGIDLGNSFSSAAAWVDGRMHVVVDSRGEPCFPSVVYFPERGPPVVGAQAVKMRKLEPANTVFGVKRILGRTMDAPEVRVLEAHSAFRMRRAPNNCPVIQTRKSECTPTEIAALILRHLRERAEQKFGRAVRQTVITLPVTVTKAAETATVQAAQMAGLEVIRTVSEPAAGALAHRIDRYEGERNLLVYDFGGGTFDVTILAQGGGRLIPIAAKGDGCLGGDDLDHALAKIVSAHVWNVHKVDVTHDVVNWDRVVQECEKVKRALSSLPASRLKIADAYHAAGRRHDLDLAITRAEVDPLWSSFVDRSMQVTAEAMLGAGLRPKDIHSVLLVGGTTYVPLVRATIQRVLGKPGTVDGDPQTAVACGAALIGARVLSLAA